MEQRSWQSVAVDRRVANVVSYLEQGVTNKVDEETSGKLMPINWRIGGNRNSENSKPAIYFYCVGLDPYPQ
ncbi:MAG: hypothetical protein KDA83_10640 [Planctomycetales bacterium]|nr:hypothetical protein [Planctomycetales bacterium]